MNAMEIRKVDTLEIVSRNKKIVVLRTTCKRDVSIPTATKQGHFHINNLSKITTHAYVSGHMDGEKCLLT